MNYPWLKDTIQYDPYEVPDYPEPQMGPENRPKYRNPAVDKSVRVYTVSQESRYLIIRNIPTTNVISELIQQLALYGTIEEYDYAHDIPSAPFTQTIKVRFEKISAARQAKNKMNKSSFFGQDLWIQYAPEYETPEDTFLKLNGRRAAVRQRITELAAERPEVPVRGYRRQARLPASMMTTGGLLDDEQALPAYDGCDNKLKIDRMDSASANANEKKEMDGLLSNPLPVPQVGEGTNKQPLQRKRKIPSQISSQIPISLPSLPPPPPSSLSEKPIGPLQEKQREVSFDPLMQRVVNRLEEIERKVETEVAKPLVKKRRRI